MNKIGIIGGGKWGGAIQFAFMKNGLQPKIWSRSVKNLPNFSSLDEVLNSEYLVVVIAAQTIRNWLKENFQDKGQKILVASKGIDIKTGKFMSEIFEDFIETALRSPLVVIIMLALVGILFIIFCIFE